ncbi:DUF3307 domain-containing protein [Tabrizicola sp.]|uniref:DUF3307 domain-containing protein n=1 Tax=Tabrizicola sp. TaxID=2005166 RepID=UPI002732C036|nr:DUF3307 domain-containing protein [Tabrizicola sp.]MDP3196426.1 DUF3307 domain-containing protein [Tabrizicola sp.]
MTETFIALLFAHTLADFVFQNDWIVRNKRNPLALGLHAVIVWLTAVATTGTLHSALLALALVHVCIDVGKLVLSQLWKSSAGFGPFMLDQALHLASLMALTLWLPDLWAHGLWSPGAAVTVADSGILGTGFWADEVALPVSHLPAMMVLMTGLILATRAGGFAIGLLMEPFAPHLGKGDASKSLPGAGRVIGYLERGLIFALVLFGQAQGVGLLIAAKSILRFGAVKDDRRLSEYVIIGTLASFGWALIVAFATLHALALTAPLGILPAAP